MLDLNLSRSINHEPVNILVKSIDANRLIFKNSKTGEGEMILRHFSTTSEITHADQFESKDSLDKVASITRLLNILNYVTFGLILVTVIWFLAYNVDFSSFLIDYVRVTKLLHRMGLINVKYPLLVETFYLYFHNLL